MCGIAGIASVARPVSEALVRRMTSVLVHRGPDDEGFHVTERVGLGARRLCIIDIEGSRQPVQNEDGSVWAVFNGELYNFREARAALTARGHSFYTKGDTEVIPHAWEEWGERCVEHLRGMFAFAVWDERRRSLLLARDRLGIKPLYYAATPGTLLFGSEMKSLLAARAEHELGAPDAAALRAFLGYGYVPTPLTMFTGARALPPAHTLVYDAAGATRLTRYWEVPREPADPPLADEAQATAEFRRLVAESVSDQMVSDVPIGAFVSGGLDSTVVAWRMSQAAAGPIRTFSIGFSEPSYDERPWARRVAARFGTLHHEERLTPKQVQSELEDILGVFDEPFADSSAIPLHFLARAARAHRVTVVLTGDGGDELFGGYETYLADRLLLAFQQWPHAARALARAAVSALPVSHRRVSLEQKLKRFMTFSEAPPLVAHALWRSLFVPGEIPRVLADGLAEPWSDAKTAELLAGDLRRFQRAELDVNTFCRLDTECYLPADMLTKVDRVTMAHSLEARVPLLDERLVDFAFRLAPALKWRGRTGKRVLRRALEGVVEPAVIRRRKAGFNVPMASWISGPLRELFRDRLSRAALGRTGFFRAEYVERLFDEHERRRVDHAYRLYALLAFQVWLERHGGAAERVR